MEGKVLSREDTKKILEVIKAIEKRQESHDFLKPVPYEALGLDDYPLIIKCPMDISTIKKKMKQTKYNSLSEILSDLMLIWDNCRTYNQAGSDIVNQANILEGVMKKSCEANNIHIEIPQKRPREEVKIEAAQETISTNLKVDFAEKVKKVNHEVLSDIVKIVENECKNAIEELEGDRIQIKVDNLDKATFDKLLSLVNNAIDESKPVKKVKRRVEN